MEQAPQEVVDFLETQDTVIESYVLVREVQVYLELGHDSYNPKINFKIWRTSPVNGESYYFTLSHNVKTPTQAGPYRPSRVMALTENGALEEAISATRIYLVGAISKGLEPDDDWLVPNKDF